LTEEHIVKTTLNDLNPVPTYIQNYNITNVLLYNEVNALYSYTNVIQLLRVAPLSNYNDDQTEVRGLIFDHIYCVLF